MESIRYSRPSVPAAFCASVTTSWLASAAKAAQVYALGQPAVDGATLIGSANGVQVRTAPTFGDVFTGTTTIKSVMGTGTTMSIANLPVSAAGDHQVQLDKVEGVKVRKNDARGIPPRGRPV